MAEEFTMADAVTWAVHELGAYHNTNPKDWPTVAEITSAVSPVGCSVYLSGAVAKALEELVEEGTLVWMIFGGRYALSSELSPSFKAKAEALAKEGS